eukprot:4617206-Prorocentrum_lima.AAC.1
MIRIACADCGTATDNVGYYLGISHTNGKLQGCHPLSTLLACADCGTVADRLGLHFRISNSNEKKMMMMMMMMKQT